MTDGLLDRIDDAARSTARLTFIDLAGRAEEQTSGAFWAHTAQTAGWLQHHCGTDTAIGFVLTNSSACVTTLLGAFRSGMVAASLPTPRRSMDLAAYVTQLEGICTHMGINEVLIDSMYAGFLQSEVLSFRGYEDAANWQRAGRDLDGAELIQFTSGSTSDPKGVCLSLEAINENIAAILDVLAPRPGDNACSWLPISHDMGLIGMLLSSLVAGGARWVDGGHVVTMRPEYFLTNPGEWMRMCSRYKITITAGPPFAYQQAARTLASTSIDLSSLRVCLVGAEHIPARTLRDFTAAAAPHGFDSTALCPAYGLAEVAVAVSMVRPENLWTAGTFDRESLGEGRVTLADGDDAVELVSNGRPLRSLTVTPTGSDQVGNLAIEGPSLLSRYTSGEVPFDPEGRFVTDDLGFLFDSEVYVVGRSDDVIVVGGVNHHPADLECRLAQEPHLPVKAGGVAVFRYGASYAVVGEYRSRGTTVSPGDLAQGLRRTALRHWGSSATRVIVVDPGTLPKTSSGKLRRHDCEQLIEDPTVHLASS